MTHLQDLHATISEHHRNMVKIHAAAMGKATLSHHKDFHAAATAEHESAADKHDNLSAECEKAESSEINKLVPTDVSRIVPDNPAFRAVPRNGSKAITNQVPVEFEKVFAVEDGL